MYIVYKTTNKINGKIYVGVHNGSNLDYLGSGKYLNDAIKHYGSNAFEKVILHECLTKQEALEIEASIVTPEFIAREDTYNLVVGGGMPPTFCGEDHWAFGKKRPDSSKRMKEANPSAKQKGERHWSRNTVHVIDEHGNIFRVRKDDPRYVSGELKHMNAGKKPYYTGKTMPLKVCPHCGHQGSGGSMKRWHFDNCRKVND